MQQFTTSKYDKLVSDYIKNAISTTNLTYQDLFTLSNSKFTKQDFLDIINGNYTFGIDEFIFLTQLLNLDINSLFNDINQYF